MYFIDGHNLIGSSAVPGVNLQQENDEERLVQWLRGRQPQLGQPLVVVFDGGIPGGTSLALSGGGVTAVFAAQVRDRADRVIYERVKDVLVRSEVTVVSNDAVLLAACQELGAQTMTVSAFMQRLRKRRKRPPRPAVKRPQAEPKLPEAEVEAWLRLFEEGDDP